MWTPNTVAGTAKIFLKGLVTAANRSGTAFDTKTSVPTFGVPISPTAGPCTRLPTCLLSAMDNIVSVRLYVNS